MTNRALWLATALSLCTACAPSIREAAKPTTSGAAEAASNPAARAAAVDSSVEEAPGSDDEQRMRAAAAAALADALVMAAVRDLATRHEMRSELSSAAFDGGRPSVLGANDATKELPEAKPDHGLFARVATGALAALLLAVVALTVGLFRTRSQVSRLRVERGYVKDSPGPGSGAAAPT